MSGPTAPPPPLDLCMKIGEECSAQIFSASKEYLVSVALISQLRTCVMEIVLIQGKLPNVVILNFHTIRNFSEGANSFLYFEKGAIDENHCSF